MTIFRGGMRPAMKMNITFSIGINVLNIFYFFEKNNIFQNNSEKLFLGGMTIFAGTGRQTTKEYNLFFEKWGTKYSF